MSTTAAPKPGWIVALEREPCKCRLCDVCGGAGYRIMWGTSDLVEHGPELCDYCEGGVAEVCERCEQLEQYDLDVEAM